MKTTIYNQHKENEEFMQKLFFYKDEIAIMQNRLSEVAKKNSSKDVLAQVEHFQNQLIIQKNSIDAIKRDISQCESSLVDNIKHNEVASDHRKVKDHTSERGQINFFEKNFNELRQELNKFLSNWM